MPLPDLRSIRYRHISPDARSLTKPPRIRDISHPRPGHSTPRFTAIRGLPRCAYRVYRASPLLQSTRPPLHHYDGRAPGKTISKHQPCKANVRQVSADAQTGMLSAEASSAICVQRFDDSRNSAIHTTYRISLRSSSLREPRYPLLRVVSV